MSKDIIFFGIMSLRSIIRESGHYVVGRGTGTWAYALGTRTWEWDWVLERSLRTGDLYISPLGTRYRVGNLGVVLTCPHTELEILYIIYNELGNFALGISDICSLYMDIGTRLLGSLKYPR